ncbi:DUF6168 family protein [Lutibacter sp.]
MNKELIGFYVRLFVFLGIVLAIHIWVLNYTTIVFSKNIIFLSYGINYALALVIYTTLFILKKKYEHILGFIFMAGSFLKFGAYFIFLNPIFKQDGAVTTVEALLFMIPYAFCLIIETIALIRLLNK